MNINKIYNKIIIITLINMIILSTFSNKSYANLGNINFNNINIEKGISQSTVEIIFQDSKGYIWLGTHDGLNRYNGYDFKIYNYEEGKNSITHNGITDITEDKYGNIWVATSDGVNKINPSKDEIINYTEENKKIVDDSTTEIITTKDNKILVCTYEGLSIYNEEKDLFEVILNEEDGILSNSIYTIDEDKDANIWIGTSLGVNKISKDFKVIESYPINAEENSLGESEVYNVYCDDENDLIWIGTDSSGLFNIDINSKKITNYTYNPDDKNSIPDNHIGEIMKDSKGYLWVGTANGLAVYNEDKNNFSVYKNKIYDKNSLVYNDVKSLLEDREGVIWVGTYSGVSIFDTNNSIKHYNAGLDEDYLLNDNMIHGVYEDDDGYLWVGTKSGGINIIDRKNNTSTYINTENNNVIISDSINDITGYNELIFVATDEGLIKINKKENTIRRYSVEDGIVSENIKDLLVDDKGYLWLGTTRGVSLLNISTDEHIDLSDYIPSDSYVRYIHQDKNGNYYLGLLKDGGLCFINTNNNTIKYYKNIKGDENSISSNRIRHINEDSKGNIWIGTSYGVNKLDTKTEKFTRYTTIDGIANNTIYGVEVDNDDNIWISTNKGISKINTNDNSIINLSVTDGLQGNEFNGNASYKSNSGELFFGGTNGLNSFYPDDINKEGSYSDIIFDGVEIDNKEYDTIDGLKLSNKTNTIKIKFFTPIYSSNKNIRYEYRLVDSSEFVSTTKENYVIFNDLSPGKHTFEVRSIDSRGNISDTITTEFYIKYPFWISPMACIIYILIAFIIIINQKNKVKKLDELVKKRTEKLQEEMEISSKLLNENIRLEKNKNSYLVNLSHELRTPINVISSTNQLILGMNKKSSPIDVEKINYYVKISQKNCTRLLNIVNDIVDNAKLQNDMYTINLKEVDIVYLVEETSLALLDYVKSKKIDLIIDPEIEEKTILCDSYEIERCIVNLIGNAAKFTPEGGSITVGVKDLDDRVMITVTDTGIGIDEKYHKTIFDKFNQIEDKTNNIKIGSGLGLTITNQIIQLHKGEIYVESKLNEGSKFVIILPANPQI